MGIVSHAHCECTLYSPETLAQTSYHASDRITIGHNIKAISTRGPATVSHVKAMYF